MKVVDVETTELDENKGCIVSIGAVDFYDPMRKFYVECRVWGVQKYIQEHWL